jgi:uncharacterized phage-associated protein
MYDARVIANAVLERAWRLGYEITQIDIQKICYFLHGHHLRTNGIPLISTEFEAWDYGPVQRSLYASFKEFGDQPITKLANSFDPIKRQPRSLPAITENSVIDTIETHLPIYLNLASFELVDLTHAPGTPWSITVSEARSSVNVGMRIANETIVKHFEGIESR